MDDGQFRREAVDLEHQDETADVWLLTPEQVAERLNLSRSKVYELFNKDLPSVRIGRCRRVRANQLREWLARQG